MFPIYFIHYVIYTYRFIFTDADELNGFTMNFFQIQHKLTTSKVDKFAYWLEILDFVDAGLVKIWIQFESIASWVRIDA